MQLLAFSSNMGYAWHVEEGGTFCSAALIIFFLVLPIKVEELHGDRMHLLEAANTPVSGQSDLTAVRARHAKTQVHAVGQAGRRVTWWSLEALQGAFSVTSIICWFSNFSSRSYISLMVVVLSVSKSERDLVQSSHSRQLFLGW